jgi:hypothetical protein
MIELIILLAIGLLAGAYSGILGIGGGLIIVPALVYFLKMSQHTAQGSSLAIMLPPITLLSVWAYHEKGFVDWKVTLFVCIGFFFGSYFGGKLAVILPAMILRKSFAIFLMFVAVNMFFKK